MLSHPSQQRRGILCAVCTWAFLIFVFPAPAQTQAEQDAAEEETTIDLDRITVTGSRIRRVDIEGATPVTVIDREAIEASGHVSVTELLRASVYNSFGSQRAQSGWFNGASGAGFVDLRGLGAENTLVLINGRRLSPFPGYGAESQDLNQIPLDMIERIEILRDGASAIYGSDAIAGVVNVITRRDMRSIVATIQLENPEPPGGESGQLALSGGFGWEEGNLTFSLEHYRREEVFSRDIPRLSNAPAFNHLTRWGFPATALILGGPLAWTPFADPRCPGSTGDSSTFPDAYRFNWSDREEGTDWRFLSTCGYNFQADTIEVPSTERNSVFADLSVDLAPATRLVGRALFSNSESESRYAAAPVSDPLPLYTADNPNNPMWLFVGQTITDPGLASRGIPGGTWTFTPDDVADVWVWMRTGPNGTRDTISEHENASFYVGLEGEAGWFGGAEWDLGLEYAYSQLWDDGYGYAYTPAIQVAIDDGSLDLFNVQGLDHDAWLAGVVAAFEPVRATTWYFGDTDIWTIDGMLGFDAFQWDSGPVPAVLGFEYYELSYDQGEDPVSQAGLIADSGGGSIVDNASRNVATLFAETLLPLGKRLELNLAVRHDNYSDFGGTTNPKISVAWRPGDAWLLRGSWGTGFKAPDMISLWEPRREFWALAKDHVGCAAGVSPCTPWEYVGIGGGNPDLEPHESESWTAGVVWNATDRLGLELTYYDIEYTNSIQRLGVGEMFNRERDGLSHTVVRNPDGTVKHVASTLINLSGENTAGIDFNVNYAVDTENAGVFGFTLEWTHPLAIEKEVIAGEGFTDYIDWIAYPENRANFTLDWSLGAFRATWVTHYIGENGVSENVCWPSWQEGPCEAGSELIIIDAFISHDLQMAWNAPWGGQVTVGARNLFDEDPPYHDCCLEPMGPADAGWKNWWLYDPLGRSVYLRYRQEF